MLSCRLLLRGRSVAYNPYYAIVMPPTRTDTKQCLTNTDWKWRLSSVKDSDGCNGGKRLARPSESRLLLLDNLALQRAQPRVDDRCLIEVAIVRFGRQLELIDGTFEVALPCVELALMLVLHQFLVERGVGARRDL